MGISTNSPAKNWSFFAGALWLIGNGITLPDPCCPITAQNEMPSDQRWCYRHNKTGIEVLDAGKPTLMNW